MTNGDVLSFLGCYRPGVARSSLLTAQRNAGQSSHPKILVTTNLEWLHNSLFNRKSLPGFTSGQQPASRQAPLHRLYIAYAGHAVYVSQLLQGDD